MPIQQGINACLIKEAMRLATLPYRWEVPQFCVLWHIPIGHEINCLRIGLRFRFLRVPFWVAYQ